MFTPTNVIGGVPVSLGDDGYNRPAYYDAEGKRHHITKTKPLCDFVAPPVEMPQLDIPQTVRLHADAVCALIRAAVWPEWGCATGFAQSPRGDSATCNPNERGPNGEKVVRICTVSPGRVSASYDILVPEFISFEIRKKAD